MNTATWKPFAALALGILPLWLCAADKPSDTELLAWVDKRVQDWQPTKDERLFDQIGWAKDIREALRLGQKHNRPVFLFTYDGANMACYRC
jgi:hypothetical protein